MNPVEPIVIMETEEVKEDLTVEVPEANVNSQIPPTSSLKALKPETPSPTAIKPEKPTLSTRPARKRKRPALKRTGLLMAADHKTLKER